jgi:hypothetical protein
MASCGSRLCIEHASTRDFECCHQPGKDRLTATRTISPLPDNLDADAVMSEDRSAVHEAGHAVIGRVLKQVCGQASIHALDKLGPGADYDGDHREIRLAYAGHFYFGRLINEPVGVQWRAASNGAQVD